LALEIANAVAAVRQFHDRMNAPRADAPTLLPCDVDDAIEFASRLADFAKETRSRGGITNDVLLIRAAIAMEELAEWLAAHAEGDLIAVADAWADRAYVLIGDAVATGLPATALFAEVHRSNIMKEPDPLGTGKAIKGAGYSPPDIIGVLRSHEAE
jgi:predicted HAD superfamily Cof-like phosphohydrolase